MTVKTKIVLGFVVSMAITLVIAIGCYLNAIRLTDAMEWSGHTREVIVGLQTIVNNAVDMETGQRGYTITGDETYLEPYNQGMAEIAKSVRAVRSLTVDNPSQQQRLDVLEPLTREQAGFMAETVAARRASGFASAQALIASGREKKLMDNIRRIVNDMIGEEERLLAIRTTAAQNSSAAMKVFGIISAVGGLLVVGLVGFAVNRSIKPLLATLFDTVCGQASAASEQEAAVTETMSTLEEITATTGQTIQKSNALGEVSTRTREEGQRGQEVLRQAVDAMALVRQKVGTIAEMNLALSEQTKQIGEITQVVSKLAQESKMLALNASIEAAKAGEVGKGFAVVATAVRSLAEQSEEATIQVQKILGDIRNATDRAVMATEEGAKQVDLGVRLVEQSGETIAILNDVIREAETASLQIVGAVRQEGAAIEQIAMAMSDIRKATAQFVNASELVVQQVTTTLGMEPMAGQRIGSRRLQ